jgi:hypothetical protein
MSRMSFGIDLHNRACMFFPKHGLDYDLGRPGRILAESAVDVPRPRALATMSRDGSVQELKGRVLERLRAEVRGG